MICPDVVFQAIHVGVVAVDVTELHAVVEVDVAPGSEHHAPVGKLEDVLHLVVAQPVLCAQAGKYVGHGCGKRRQTGGQENHTQDGQKMFHGVRD